MALASYAMDAVKSRGRRYPEPPHPYRNDYARDRDRVIHSRAFRRLEAKTQVFTTRFSDHFRNRLTHTLEVAQIARTVAGALELNADLAEALALAHDIGHPPFGHAGERKLDQLLRPHGDSFNHNLQALRIVEQFEQRYLDFPGLNLTFEVREGIVKHSRDYDAAQYPSLSEYLLDERPPIEAQLIDFVDEIAYNTADLDDGYEAHVLDIEMIRAEVPLFARFYDEVERSHPHGAEKLKFNEAAKRVLDYLATGLIENTRSIIVASGVQSVEDIRHAPRRLAGFSPPMAAENAALKKFLHTRLYNNPAIVGDRERSVEALAQLFTYYVEHPAAMPKAYAELAQRAPKYRVVCDYIAGMTDHFLLRQHAELLGTGSARSA
ncbi:MAG: deoxyguanosinetriphosphate triphosphohydrolase [Candidatus Acidiferrales bacterium]